MRNTTKKTTLSYFLFVLMFMFLSGLAVPSVVVAGNEAEEIEKETDEFGMGLKKLAGEIIGKEIEEISKVPARARKYISNAKNAFVDDIREFGKGILNSHIFKKLSAYVESSGDGSVKISYSPKKGNAIIESSINKAEKMSSEEVAERVAQMPNNNAGGTYHSGGGGHKASADVKAKIKKGKKDSLPDKWPGIEPSSLDEWETYKADKEKRISFFTEAESLYEQGKVGKALFKALQAQAALPWPDPYIASKIEKWRNQNNCEFYASMGLKWLKNRNIEMVRECEMYAEKFDPSCPKLEKLREAIENFEKAQELVEKALQKLSNVQDSTGSTIDRVRSMAEGSGKIVVMSNDELNQLIDLISNQMNAMHDEYNAQVEAEREMELAEEAWQEEEEAWQEAEMEQMLQETQQSMQGFADSLNTFLDTVDGGGTQGTGAGGESCESDELCGPSKFVPDGEQGGELEKFDSFSPP